MVVIDSSAWIEWLTGSPTGVVFRSRWPAPEEIIVPTLVQLELAKWLRRETSDHATDRAIARTMTHAVIPLDTRMALRAAGLCAEHKLSTADAVIYATALENDATLLTCDAHFEGLEGVEYVAKVE
jgi:uncharacterized protein